MLTEDGLRELVNELTGHREVRERAFYSWMRYLVGLGSGALTLLVALGRASPSPRDSVLDRVALISLALGILFGSLRIYGEVWTADGILKDLMALRREQISDEKIPDRPIDVRPIPFSVVCERICYLSLFVALISFVILAWHLHPSNS